MDPYNYEFIKKEMKKYDAIINQNEFKLKGCSVYKDKVNLKKIDGYMCKLDKQDFLSRIKFFKDREFIMEISTKDIQGSYNAIKFAKGKVGVVGLGLGYVVQEMAENSKVEEIVVYEIDKDIIEIYNRNFKHNSKIKIINKDAYKAEREKFDFFFVDIYGYELTIKVVEDYKKFNALHDIKEYSFWGVEHFLLSCKYDEILWVFIPENWVEMSKKLYEAMDMSDFIKSYEPLDQELVSNILMEFKTILNEL